jgi:hypothetical protein
MFGKKKKPGAPDFIIVGAQKAATSSLYKVLCSHPDIHPAERKEIHFFDFNYDQGAEWYKDQLKRPKGKICGEASPFYIYHPKVATRIERTFPRVKLIFIFRDPVERALSHYRMNVAEGIEPLSPLRAMVAEEQRILEALKKGENRDNPESTFQRFTYKARGHYDKQWMEFARLFPKKQMFAMRMETLLTNPGECMDALVDFLGLTSHSWPKFPHINPTPEQQHDEGFARKYLQTYFTRHWEQTKSLVPLSVGKWNDEGFAEKQEVGKKKEAEVAE